MWGYGPDWGMMGGWGGTWWGLFGMFFWLLLLVAVIVAIVWIVRAMTQGSGREPQLPQRRLPGLDLLEERYAKGEIGRDEFVQKKRDLGG